MGAREDFMAMRRAAHFLDTIADGAPGDQVTCKAQLLRKASAREVDFIRLAKAGIQDELIDLAWAVLGEPRPGGPAVGQQDGEAA